MKHDIKITLVLITIFFLSQIVGLFIVNEYVSTTKLINQTTGEEYIEINYSDIEVINTKIEHPEVNESFSFIYIMIAIIVATLFVLLLVKFRSFKIWKAWFAMSVFFATYIALSPFILKIPFMTSLIAKIITTVIVVVLVALKLFRSNVFVHNFTEVVMYGGIAAIFVPITNLFSACMLLVLISIYDMYAVWKSKHMVSMAQFQTKSNVFAGLYLMYDNKTKKICSDFKKIESNPKPELAAKDIPTPKHVKQTSLKQAILGGGDITFPLIFASAVLKFTASLWLAGIIAIFSTIAISLLFMFSKPNKFYPAMPYISAGCFAGLGVVFLIQLII
ncbi:hypothetical protein JXM83_02820 [Candidatus Woesearchaeota archaeon]|nr:hypothetical protein [Candidatus Woesearchaeota archaeon]